MFLVHLWGKGPHAWKRLFRSYLDKWINLKTGLDQAVHGTSWSLHLLDTSSLAYLDPPLNLGNLETTHFIRSSWQTVLMIQCVSP